VEKKMKVRMRLAIPLLLAGLAGCAADQPSPQYTAATAPASAAAPQQVNAASDALGQRLDNMMAKRRTPATSVTR
jgi:hypothetical protein